MCDTVNGKDFRVDLIVLDLVDFDVILGMDLLASYHAIVDCQQKTVQFAVLVETPFQFRGDVSTSPSKLISSLRPIRLLKKRCLGYLVVVRDVSVEAPSITQILVVMEFLDVFPDEFPGKPPDREIEFYIDLVPDAQPISIPPYRMALAELKEQLHELLDKGFIHPSTSPWGALVLFVKKKYGSLRLCVDYQ